jgi:hypothetical protein
MTLRDRMSKLPPGSSESVDESALRYFAEKDIYRLDTPDQFLFIHKSDTSTFTKPIKFSSMKQSLWSALKSVGHTIKKVDVDEFLLHKFPANRRKLQIAFTDDLTSDDTVNLFNDSFLKGRILRPIYDPSRPVHPLIIASLLLYGLDQGQPVSNYLLKI